MKGLHILVSDFGRDALIDFDDGEWVSIRRAGVERAYLDITASSEKRLRKVGNRYAIAHNVGNDRETFVIIAGVNQPHGRKERDVLATLEYYEGLG